MRGIKMDNIDKMYYLTPMQEGMLFHVLKDTYCNAYFGQGIFQLKGEIDVEFFEQALAIVSNQNDALRTKIVYKKMKRPVQIVLKKNRLAFSYSNLNADKKKQEKLKEAVLKDRETGIQLDSDNLVHFKLFQMDQEEYVFVFSFHHIILDGWCVGILAEEIFSAYHSLKVGEDISVKQTAPYINYVHWLEKQDKTKSSQYWKEYLSGIETVTDLPGDLSGDGGYKRKECHFPISADIQEGIYQIAGKYGVTANIIVDAVWGILLQKYNYTNDVVFGTVVSGRNAKVRDAGKMIGLFINTLPLRVTVKEGETFSQLVKKLQINYLKSDEYAYASLSDIQKVCELGGETVSHLMAFQNFPLGKMLGTNKNSEILVKEWSVFQQTNYDLSIEVLQHDTMEYYVVYNENKYSDRFMKRLEKQLTYLFQQVTSEPEILIEKIQIAEADVQDRILHVFNDTWNDLNLKCSIPDDFRMAARTYPEKEIIRKGGEVLTYFELDQKSDVLMQLLLEKGCKRGEIVGILANDTLEMIIGMVGILKAGGAYLPIEPSYPFTRKERMLKETNARFLLRTSEMPEELDFLLDVILLDKEETWKTSSIHQPPELSGEDLAYVMFTSGTTNQPKGVMVRQKSVIRLVKNTNYVEITKNDRILKTGSIVFDASTFEIWGSLLCGASLYLLNKEEMLDSKSFERHIKEDKITILWLTAALFNQFVDSNVFMFSGLKYLITGGDTASVHHFNQVIKKCPGVTLVNGYGPTENTTFSVCYSMKEIRKDSVPIGKPISNSTAYITDIYGNLLDIGMPGELCTGGYGVAAGYLGDEKLTSQKYVRDPFFKTGTMYRTGDMAYWMEDGNIGFLGRLDKQLKIRGFRVSLSEIEDTIRRCISGIQDVSVICGENKRLYAFLSAQQQIDREEVKQELKKELPDYMIPAVIVQIGKIPVTMNGKADKKKLLELLSEKKEVEFESPRTPLEIELSKIWAETLKMTRVSVTDNFFEAGGDSILAMSMTTKANKRGIDITITDLYQNPDIKGLAAAMEAKQAGEVRVEEIPQYEADLEHEYEEFPLNEIQMAYLMGRNPKFELGGFSTHFYAEFDTEIDMERFSYSLNQVIRRHPMMRAVIYERGTQKILEEVPEYKVVIEDLTNLSEKEKEACLEQERKRMEQFVFPLESWPMFELKAFKLGMTQYQLNFGIDVLIVDGASFFRIAEDLNRYYKGEDSKLENLEFSFRDYTLALKDFRTKPEYERQKQYWMQKIEEFPNAPVLPMISEPLTLKNVKFKRKQGILHKSQWEKIKKEAKMHNVTAAGLLCTVYAKILGHWSGQEELAVNTTVFSRYPFHKDVEKLVGDFTCIMLLAIHLDGKKEFWQQVGEVQKVLGDALEHRNYSGVEFTREIAKYRGQNGRAVMPYVFTCALFDNAASSWKDIGQMKYARSQTPQVYLDNQIIETDGELSIVWDYPAGLFEQELIDEMFLEYMDILEHIADGEVREPGLSQRDLELATMYNATGKEIPFKTLHGLFQESAAQYPELPAVSCGERMYTYAELNEYSDRMAACLRENGVCKGDKVSVLGTRCLETIVNIIAILKAGGTYIPINPEYPKERQEYIVKNSASRLFLKPDSYMEMKADACQNRLTAEEDINAAAYVIYTSGSTGQPKGVVIGHKEAANTIQDMNCRFGISCCDKVIGLSSMGFDLSVYDIFGTLGAGAELILVKDQRDVREIRNILEKKAVTVWNSVPAIMEMFVDSLEEGYQNHTLKHVWLSGDWIPLNLPEKIRTYFKQTDITSLGGATEASIWSIYYPIETLNPSWMSIPYGMPLSNQQIYILDSIGDICPCGAAGEIYIGGFGVAREYLNDKVKTEYAFVEHPEYGRLYRTGDYGKMLREGYVEFLGRRDSQVKVRGYRIEFGEIEAAMNEFPRVQSSIVDVYEAENGAKQLIGYVVLDEEASDERKTQLYESIEAKTRDASLSYEGTLSQEKLKELNDAVEDISTAYIYQNCLNLGLDVLLTEGRTLEEICQMLKIVPEYTKLFRNWLDILVEDCVLEELAGIYKWVSSKKIYDIESMWTELETQDWPKSLSTSFAYLRQSGENHINMLLGKVNALTLFFPEGSMVTAESLYKFSPIAEYLNNMIHGTIQCLVEGWSKERKLRVLEIGAGTGGTTDGILPLFDADNTEYMFTDLSDFFLEEAKKRYKKYSFLKYGLLDINEEIQSQGYEYASYDVILCANVIHDAQNIQKTLQSIKNLLDNRGILILIEGTKNSRQQLASVRFIEGLSQFEDERLESGRPLLSVSEWEQQFMKAGLQHFGAFPECEELSDLFGNHLILGQKCLKHNPPKEMEIKAYLNQKIPSYMVPSKLIQMDEIPLTANNKVNRKALVKPAAEKIRKGNYVSPVTECQKKLASVWEEVLKIEKPGIRDSFFDLGGDSLKAVEIVSKAENQGIHISLTDMFTYLTIQELSDVIAEKEKSRIIKNIDNLMLIREGTESDKDIFFVHAGSGEVGVYVELCRYIDKSYNCWAFSALKRDSVGPENITMEALAARYIMNMKKVRPYGPYDIAGWCVGGTIAFEMVRQLEKSGEKVTHLTLINSNAPSRESREKVIPFSGNTERMLMQQFSMKMPQQIEKGEMEPDDIWEVIVAAMNQGKLNRETLKKMIPPTILRVIPEKDEHDNRTLVKYVNRIRSYVNARDYYIPDGQVNADVLYVGAAQEKIENCREWNLYTRHEIEFIEVPGNHVSIFEGENVKQLADKVNHHQKN